MNKIAGNSRWKVNVGGKWISAASNEVRINQTTRNRANKAIAPFSTGRPVPKIPLGDIFDALKSHGLIAIQEDNTPWEGFLTGAEGRTQINLAVDSGSGTLTPVANAVLVLMWHKFDSGNYEITAYVS